MTTTTKTISTAEHYTSHTAESYEAAYFYSNANYLLHFASLVREYLCLGENGEEKKEDEPIYVPYETHNPLRAALRPRRLLDIGGGTGNFTRMVLDGSTPGTEGIVMDPFLSSATTSNGPIQFVRARAEDFINSMLEGDACSPLKDSTPKWWCHEYDFDQVLMKEVIHHIPQEVRRPFFTALRRLILRSARPSDAPEAGAPSVLIVTRPRCKLDCPLWDGAREVRAKLFPPVEDIVDDLVSAGFKHVQWTIESYPCVILLEQWTSMVKARCWSAFSHFEDKELEEACREIERTADVDCDGRIHFEERMLFITASL